MLPTDRRAAHYAPCSALMLKEMSPALTFSDNKLLTGRHLDLLGGAVKKHPVQQQSFPFN